MDKPAKLHERIAFAVGTGILSAPLCFLIWFGLNLRLLDSAEIAIIWVFVAVGIIALLGFVFTHRISRMMLALWNLLSWF